MALPGAALDSEAFVDVMSESFYGARAFLKVIAGVFGNRVKRIYLMNPYHRFNSTGMKYVTDIITNREYALRPSTLHRDDHTSLTHSAALLLAPEDQEFLMRPTDQARLASMFSRSTIRPSHARDLLRCGNRI